jgi:hypothetical protein
MATTLGREGGRGKTTTILEGEDALLSSRGGRMGRDIFSCRHQTVLARTLGREGDGRVRAVTSTIKIKLMPDNELF